MQSHTKKTIKDSFLRLLFVCLAEKEVTRGKCLMVGEAVIRGITAASCVDC